MRGVDDDRPPEGEHVTLVDEITEAVLLPIRNRLTGQAVSRLLLGSGRGKVTATFFHPRKWIQGPAGPKAPASMLSGEVGYFRGAMQLTHPDFPRYWGMPSDGKNRGRQRSIK